jgi:hypothetical protein
MNSSSPKEENRIIPMLSKFLLKELGCSPPAFSMRFQDVPPVAAVHMCRKMVLCSCFWGRRFLAQSDDSAKILAFFQSPILIIPHGNCTFTLAVPKPWYAHPLMATPSDTPQLQLINPTIPAPALDNSLSLPLNNNAIPPLTRTCQHPGTATD